MPNILIVDDDIPLAENMVLFLEHSGHTVKHVENGNLADIAMSEADYDLLILDWELPDTTGPEICESYREKGGMGAVLILTGRASTQDKVTGLGSGADDYLTKPFNIAEFGARIKALLRRAMASKPQDPLALDESMVGKTFASCYKVESVLGKGAMGIVFKAHHMTIERQVAIKVLSTKNVGVGAQKRFEREAKAMSMLDHPNLIKIYDYGLANGSTPYIVMELVEGSPLSTVLQECGSLPAKYALPIFIQICDAIEHAHQQSIIHRDLKPANIIMANNVKVVDLGVAKFTEADEADPQLTFAGEIFGSPAYMSPEQGTNKPLDPRSDIYSLGCLMFEVLTGAMPFAAYSFVELINTKTTSRPPSIIAKKPEARFPLVLDQIITRAMEPEMNKRQGSVTELKRQLEQVLAELEQGGDEKAANKGLPYLKGLFRRDS